MESKLVPRGLLAGAIAGLVAYVFARIFAEPQIQKAIGYESARDTAQAALDRAAGLHPDLDHSEVFTRTVQADVGLGVGLIMFGAAMGLLVAVVYTVCLGRVGRLRPRPLALLVAGAGFVALYLVPFVKYPANPPSIGHAETVRERTALYVTMLVASVVCTVLAVVLGRRLAARFGNWTATLAAVAAFVVVVGVVMLVLPALGDLAYNRAHFPHSSTETPQPLRNAAGQIVFPGFPADVLFSFRMYSIEAQLLMWTVIGVVFAPLAERVVTAPREAALQIQ
jgi:uncharacterized membrane protein